MMLTTEILLVFEMMYEKSKKDGVIFDPLQLFSEVDNRESP